MRKATGKYNPDLAEKKQSVETLRVLDVGLSRIRLQSSNYK